MEVEGKTKYAEGAFDFDDGRQQKPELDDDGRPKRRGTDAVSMLLFSMIRSCKLTERE